MRRADSTKCGAMAIDFVTIGEFCCAFSDICRAYSSSML